jgi:hypothetical protein
MALDKYFQNKIEKMKLEIIQGQAVLRRLEAQRNDYNSRVRLLREELGLLQQPGSYVGEVVKVMGTKKVLVKVHPEGKYGGFCTFVFLALPEVYYLHLLNLLHHHAWLTKPSSRRYRRRCRHYQAHHWKAGDAVV